ncbi:uncharacterized protein DNG_05752 [Cephalotrichum gorgonifer]|uniref:Protein kinase domain-containing protein n=1 Tax=Cephalotrichum gorgonifer TaxID=2041049 RepID=A0AAE8MYJ8_9PEZI|nr:uncharacterized protein DNG_05752 [Cephalotrichum gorgonifer]
MTSLYDELTHRISQFEKTDPSTPNKTWFPLSLGRELLRDEALAALSELEDSARLTSTSIAFIRDHAPQLFAMLLYLGKVDLIGQFCDEYIGDAMFPVKLTGEHPPAIETTSTEGSPPRKLMFGRGLSKCEAETIFGYLQWRFFVPKLLWTAFEHKPFECESCLPFTEFNEVSRTEFSTVYKAVVGRDHISFDPDGLPVAKNGCGDPYVAVKQLQPNGLNRSDYASFVKAEHEALDMLRGFKTAHLIKATAFYKQKIPGGENLYFVFPWAEHGNLREFWKEKIPSIWKDGYVKWVFKQLEGLADAIRTLHHANDRICRHGDLKPENVLCFNSPDSTEAKDHTSCILVISDVGLARTHDKSTRFRSKTKMVAGETVAYAAPETELFPQRATSRRYDIWSFGCLCLEFVIWLLYGIEELERFGREVRGCFYVITTGGAKLGADGNKSAEVKQEVKNWMEHIKKDARCAKTDGKETAIGRLVLLVEKRLLVVAASPHPKDPNGKPDEPTGDNTLGTSSTEQADAAVFQINVRAPTLTEEALTGMGLRTLRIQNVGEDVERAYVPEVLETIISISKDAEQGIIDWVKIDIDGAETVSFRGPGLGRDATVTTLGDPTSRVRELDNEWSYIPDEDIAERLRASLDQLPHPSNPSELCSRCAGLPLWSQECSFDDTAAKLEESSFRCALCRLLFRSLLSRAILPGDDLHFFRIGSSLRFNNKRLPPIASLYALPASEADETLNGNVQTGFPSLPDPGSPTHVEVLREWIRDCDTHQCSQFQDAPFLPTRLLDVGKHGSRQAFLICDTGKLAEKTKYIALSHRWGSPPKPGAPNPLGDKVVSTYEKNIESLRKGIDDSQLPPLYQDAITIVRELKVRYLWIDSLCVIQHNKSDPLDEDKGRDFRKEAELMERVFRSAYVTIAASCAGSPAEHFLRTRPEREAVAMRAGTAAYYVCDAIDDFHGDVEQGELNERGWVLQERALSRRTIYFAEKQTYWECGEGVRCETLTRTRSSKASFLGDANFPHSFPDYIKGLKIKLYQDLYELYSKLALSYPTDRPVAIRGLETRLLSVLNTRGGYGVLDVYLRRGLLWQRAQTSLKRIDFPDGERGPVPSWSWMAYDGAIQYMNVPFGGVDWDKWDRDVVSPWEKCEGDNGSGALELRVLVREIAGVEPGARVFLDEPSRTFDRPFKCVVVGSSMESNQGKATTYYTLIVTSLNTGEENVYERAGVAFLHRQNIVWDGSGTEARIR